LLKVLSNDTFQKFALTVGDSIASLSLEEVIGFLTRCMTRDVELRGESIQLLLDAVSPSTVTPEIWA
jgi:hypothetical protein